MDQPNEVELKLQIELDAAGDLVDASVLAGHASKQREQISIYFDTADQAVRRAGFSLRVRHAGDLRTQTVKADAAGAGLFERGEWERVIDTDAPQLDGTPLAEVLSARDLERLAPAFEVRVIRRIWDVSVGDGQVEVVLDQGEVSVEGRAAAVCEIELELKTGAPTSLFELARALDQVVPVRLGVMTKSQRGYHLVDGAEDRPVKSEALSLKPETSTAAGFQAVAYACLRQFRLNEEVLARTRSDGALHQARVALRRLRSALSVFKPVLADEQFEPLRGELRWLAATLGEARNIDVLLGRAGREGPAAEALLQAREHAYAAVAAALQSPRARTLMIDLAEWVAAGRWLTAPTDPELVQERVQWFAATTLDRYRRRLKRRGEDLEELDDEERHQVRILAKKLRYSVEFFGELFSDPQGGKRHKAFLQEVEALQEGLGGLNDLVTGPQVMADLGIPQDPGLEGEAAPRRAKLLQTSVASYDRLLGVTPFWR